VLLFFKNLLYTAVLPATVTIYLPLYLVKDSTTTTGGLFLVAVVLLSAGTVIFIRSLWDFAAYGRGTPAPIDAPKKLVIRGIYLHTRNPIYIGVLAIILGWASLYQSKLLLIYAFWTGVFFQGFVILYEERHLRKQYGTEYQQYCTRVNRWLPKIFFGLQ
jgi:protein-S-isoprenylcysteine O-methyltransferase Ste14